MPGDMLMLLIFEGLYDFSDKRVSDNVFIFEGYCLDALYLLSQFYAFEETGILSVR